MSRDNPSIVWELACSMLRDLSGYKGYPKPIDSPGEHHFIRAFQEAVVSVEHAQAVVDTFDQEFPTILRLREAATNLRPRFENRNQHKEWEREFGKPDPNWSKNLVGGYNQQKRKLLWQGIRDSVFYTEGPGRFQTANGRFWADAMAGHCKKHPQELAGFREELAKRGWDAVMEEDWANEVQTPKSEGPIAQADIDRVKQQRDVKALASGETEDRWE